MHRDWHVSKCHMEGTTESLGKPAGAWSPLPSTPCGLALLVCFWSYGLASVTEWVTTFLSQTHCWVIYRTHITLVKTLVLYTFLTSLNGETEAKSDSHMEVIRALLFFKGPLPTKSAFWHSDGLKSQTSRGLVSMSHLCNDSSTTFVLLLSLSLSCSLFTPPILGKSWRPRANEWAHDSAFFFSNQNMSLFRSPFPITPHCHSATIEPTADRWSSALP